MFGRDMMKKDNNLNKDSFMQYIDKLTNNAFSILPIFEEEGFSENLVARLKNLKIKMDGFLLWYECKAGVRVEIMSLLTKIDKDLSHQELRYCVLRICSLLSSLKSGDINVS